MSSQQTSTIDKPEFDNVPPGELIIGANVRGRRFDKKFLDSVRNGLHTAITGYRNSEGRIVVLWGQQRTLAAVEAERETVPVMIIPEPDDVGRIVGQVEENDKRTALTNSERIAAFEQLAAYGLPAAQIARRTSRDKKEVVTALAVAASPLAKGAAERYEFLDLYQAAAVAEFADDKEAVKHLIVTAKEGGAFDHEAQKLRDARAEVAKRATLEAELTESGLRVLTAEERQDTTKARLLRMLVDADRQDIEPEAHQGCPGHAVYVEKGWHYIEVPVDQDDELDDGDLDDDDGPTTREKEVYDWLIRYVCTDWREHGHQERYSSTGSAPKKAAADKTDEEREADRAKRRDVIQSNKDWLSATTVRQEWLRTFLTRKTAPKTAAAFVAGSLGGIGLSLTDGYGLAYELLALKGQGQLWELFPSAYAEAVRKASEARAQVLSLALVLSAYEYQLRHKDTWRTDRSEIPRYLRYLETCGYKLADIERRACGETPGAAGKTGSEDSADPAPAAE